MKASSKSEKIKAFIAPKMTDLITLLENNRKYAVYTGGNIHRLHRYVDIIGAPMYGPLQVNALIILVLNLTSKMINQFYIKLL